MKILPFENLKLHVIVWSLYIVYDRLYLFVNAGTAGNIPSDIAIYTVNIALFYFNGHVVLPNVTTKGRINYLKFILMVYILCKLIVVFIFHVLHLQLIPGYVNFQSFVGGYLLRSFILLGYSTAYSFALFTYYNQRRVDDLIKAKLVDELATQQLEQNLLVTENAYLKSQINPHFLLNTLNFLYNSVAKYSEQVADSFMTLADIMRYALTNAGEDGKVSLEAELEHIANFIKLNQVRFNQRLCVEYMINGEPGDLRIIPLVLVTLVENVFKYGDLLNQGHPARIIADIDGNNLTFVTHNLKRKRVTNLSHGIGLKNVRSRLTMYHQFELDVEDNETVYESTLKIQL
jgi:two-component system LytT family sensor kinase